MSRKFEHSMSQEYANKDANIDFASLTKTYSYGNNAPPSFESAKIKDPTSNVLFQSIQYAQERASQSCQLLKRCGTIVACSVSIILILGILMAIPLGMIIVGALNIKNCTIAQMIPIWLIIAGALSIIKNLSTLIQRIKALNDNKQKQSSNTLLNIFDTLMTFILLGWFIVGNYYVYSNYKKVNYTDITSPDFCDKLTFEGAFWIITAVYILIVLSCLIFCCTVCFTICISPKK